MRARRSWLTAGIIVGCMGIGHGVQACDADPGDPWFHVELQINKLALPSSVEVDARETKSGDPVLVVSNTSDIPIEIAGETLGSGGQVILAGEKLNEALGTSIESRRGDNRPPNVVPPPGRQFLIVVIRQGQRLLLPGTIQYRINAAYDPQKSAHSLERCEKKNWVWIAIGVLVLVVTAVALVRSTLRGRT